MKLTKGKLIFLITFACITLAILLTRFTSKNATECVPSEVTITCENNLVSLSSETYCSIYYTVDGSIPSADSILYTGPFELKKVAMLCSASDSIAVGDYSVLDGEVPVANVIRAIAIAPDGTCSNVVTCTCFDREQDLTVISMIIDYAFFTQVHICPAGEQIQFVPFTFAVAYQNEFHNHLQLVFTNYMLVKTNFIFNGDMKEITHNTEKNGNDRHCWISMIRAIIFRFPRE